MRAVASGVALVVAAVCTASCSTGPIDKGSACFQEDLPPWWELNSSSARQVHSMVAAAAVLGYRPDVPSALPAPRRVLVQDKTIPRRFRSIVFLFAGHPGARFAVYERPRSQPFEPAVQRTQFDAPACQYADAGTFPDGRPWVRVVSTVHVTVMWSAIHGLQAILTASADQLTPEAALAKARLAEQ